MLLIPKKDRIKKMLLEEQHMEEHKLKGEAGGNILDKLNIFKSLTSEQETSMVNYLHDDTSEMSNRSSEFVEIPNEDPNTISVRHGSTISKSSKLHLFEDK